MNFIQGAPFYDTLNRLVIGFLLLLPFVYGDTNLNSHNYLCVGLFSIVCYLFGLFFSMITDYLAEKEPEYFNCFFYKNKLSYINKILSKELPSKEPIDTKGDYYEYYYTVERRSLLGSVSAMEALSAFMLNLGSVMIYYIVFAIVAIIFHLCPTCLHVCCCAKSPCCFAIFPCCVIPVSAFIFLICCISRNRIEKKIYSGIICAFKYLESHPDEMN